MSNNFCSALEKNTQQKLNLFFAHHYGYCFSWSHVPVVAFLKSHWCETEPQPPHPEKQSGVWQVQQRHCRLSWRCDKLIFHLNACCFALSNDAKAITQSAQLGWPVVLWACTVVQFKWKACNKGRKALFLLQQNVWLLLCSRLYLSFVTSHVCTELLTTSSTSCLLIIGIRVTHSDISLW